MIRCTGVNCPMQNGTVDPKNCIAESCQWRTIPMTNADRIRAMTDEELAEWISCNCVGDGYGNEAEDWLDWLKQEVSE